MKKANPLCEICKKRPECSERFLHIWKFGVVFTALSRVFLDAQAVDGAGKVRLRGAVFAHAALLEDGLFRLIGGALCTFGIDLFRVLGGVYKHEDIVALDLRGP